MTRLPAPRRQAGAQPQTLDARLSMQGRLRRYALLSGMGLTVAAASLVPGAAAAAQFGSTAWFAARSANIGVAAIPSSTPASSGVPGAVTTPQQALIQARRSIADLSRAAQVIAAAQAAQALSAQQALQTGADHLAPNLPDVPDGLASNGLQVAPGVGTDPSLWLNAKTPTQATANGTTTVTVAQTAQKAILTWQTFNVGKHTTVDFDQSLGTQSNGSNNWIALNRVLDPSASPTQILGQIKADGSVYLINTNGIIFGGSSQVNVHSLIATSLPLFSGDVAASNQFFLTKGIGDAVGSSQPLLDGSALANAGTLPGSIAIQAGASIDTGDQGFSLIAAPNVSNAGTVTASNGQAILAAGITLQQPGSLNQTSSSSSQDLAPVLTYAPPAGDTLAGFGALSNTGLVVSPRGNISLLGGNVVDDGVLVATTSVSTPGSIKIQAQDGQAGTDIARLGSVQFGADSLTALLPQEDGQTTTSSAAATQTFQTGTIAISGGAVTFSAGAQVEAPGENLSVTAMIPTAATIVSGITDGSVIGRVYLDNNTSIDVAGLANIELPMSDNLVDVTRLGGNELADSPVQRGSVLFGTSIVVDARDSGTGSDGTSWVGTPLANVSGYVQQVPRKIDQLLQNGGSVALVGQEVLSHAGSSIDLDGGYLHYLAGSIATTRLMTTSGGLVDIADADPNTVYACLAGVSTQAQSRWNLSTTYTNPLLAGLGGYETDYISGGNGGTLKVTASTAVLDGGVSAQAFAGRHQVSSGQMPSGGTFFAGGGAGAVLPSYIIEDSIPDLDKLVAGFGADTALPDQKLAATDPDNLQYWTPLSGVALSNAGFSTVTIQADNPGQSGQAGQIVVAAGSGLQVQHGGTINLTGAAVTVEANLSARAGAINLTAVSNTEAVPTFGPLPASGQPPGGNIVVRSGATLDASGLWVNDAGLDVDQQTGAAYINGGRIALQVLQNSVAVPAGTPACGAAAGCVLDTTGSVILQQGSLLDVSSGGRVLPSGQFQASANGVLSGKGGSIALETYVPNNGTGFGSEGLPLPTAMPTGGTLQLDGTLRGFGFDGGGTLSLRALGIQIGGSGTAAPDWALQLPADFFAGQGFGAYVLTAEYDAAITAGTVVTPTQSSLVGNVDALAAAATGTGLFGTRTASPSGALVTVGQLDAYDRQATGFSLYAGDYLSWRTTSGAAPDYAGSASLGGLDAVNGTVLLGRNAAIDADAGAAVTLGSLNQVTVYGSIVAHGGSITLTADSAQGGLAAIPGQTATQSYSSGSKSVWLGPDSLLDVSGIALINPNAAPVNVDGTSAVPVTGKVLDGGTVTLTDDTGYVIALSCIDAGTCTPGGDRGARIDVSGAKAIFDLPFTGSSSRYNRREVWSNAGSINVGAGGGLVFDARLSAKGGSDKAEGGTLSVFAENALPNKPGNGFGGARNLVVLNGRGALPAGALQPGQSIEGGAGAPSGTVRFNDAVLKNSGIDNLVLGVDPALGNTAAPVPVDFAANVDLSLGRSITINASALSGIVPASGTSDVVLDAPYVALHGYAPSGIYHKPATLQPTAAGVTLTVQADYIDLGGQFELRNFGEASFDASHDIRFVTPSAYDYYSPNNTTPQVAIPGFLLTAGNLTFQAAQIYPATANTFIVEAIDTGGAQTTVTFQSNANSASAQTPISAGGSLIVDADQIVQGGVLRAPDGQILLGVGSASDPAAASLFSFQTTGNGGQETTVLLPVTSTQSVELTAGSVTSVSLDGITVPYGQTVDGQNWLYNGGVNSGSSTTATPADLTAPPSKLVIVDAASVSLDKGATVDLSGGGDLQAQEWVPGTGGSRDVLSQFNTSYASGTAQQVALYADARGVYAIIPGYSGLAPYDPSIVAGDPLVGQAVYLSGAPGLPAGVYTLLPGKYATLPGAYRVVQDTAATDMVPVAEQTLADGTLMLAGRLVDSLDGAKSARNLTFMVQSSPVWQQYSQYTLTSADNYFTQLAQHNASVVPQLPQDAGHLELAASATLALGGTLLDSAAPGGVGAQVDIASQDLQITGIGATPLAGYVQVSAAALDSLDASSLLLGGTRLRTAGGDQITTLADNLVFDNGADALTAPEIVAVGSAGVTVDAGSIVQAKGSIAAAADVPIVIGSTGGATGNGALLRVSDGASVTVSRVNLGGSGAGLLSIGAGAQIGGGAALTLDSSGNTVVDASAQFAAPEIDADSQLITFGGTGAGVPGLVVSPQLLKQFAQAQVIDLSSRGAMDFVGNVDINLAGNLTLNAGSFSGDGGAVSIQAGILTLGNALAAPTPVATAGTGTLALQGQQVDFAAGAASTAGFGSVTATAADGIVTQGRGSFDFGTAAVTFKAPVLIADAGSAYALGTAGTLAVLGQTGGAALAETPLGGSVSLTGGTVDLETAVEALGGNVKLHATAGDLRLGATGSISVHGLAKTFYDTVQYANAGAISLVADHGQVVVPAGATLDFAAAAGGNAGSLEIAAPEHSAQLAGTLKGGAAAGYLGGSFSLEVGGSADLDALVALLTAGGVTDSVDVRTGAGNLTLSAGNSLTARNVTLVADGGGAPSASDGNVAILGTIDASGAAGGNISLYGRSGVDVEGTLNAAGSAPDQLGGNVVIGTSGSDPGGAVNATYGYENIAAANSGTIAIGAGARIDVGGGSAGGLSGGTVHLIAPLLENGEVNVRVDPAAQIGGQREFTLEAYAQWSTTDASQGALHFDGIVDPAGAFDAAGNAVAFNADHFNFYQTTLVDFVENGGAAFAFDTRLSQLGIAHFTARPGIELSNPAGNISVLSNWNLGAGTSDTQLFYRYQGGIAPVLSLRAAGNVAIEASISDGFWQYSNPVGDRTTSGGNSISPLDSGGNPLSLLSASLNGAGADSTSYRIVAGADSASADPLALSGAATLAGSGDVTFDGHSADTIVVNKRTGASVTIYTPTLLRTGVGSIDIAAAHDFALLDTVAPGVVYSAGRPDANAPAPAMSSALVAATGKLPYLIDSGTVNADGAGNVSIQAGNDITGIEQVLDDGSRTGTAGTNLSQYWWPWLQSACVFSGANCAATPSGSSINFGNFDQGVMSVGGNVDIAAGGNIRDLGVSLPTSWYLSSNGSGGSTVVTVGGGNLSVTAGGSILSGTYFVAKGSGTIVSHGSIAADIVNPQGGQVATLFALQDAQLQVSAASGANVGGVFNPSYLYAGFDSQSYSASSSFSLSTNGGDIAFDTLALPSAEFSLGSARLRSLTGDPFILPATLELTALNGGIAVEQAGELYPSATGELSLIADQTVQIYHTVNPFQQTSFFGLIDAPASVLPSPLNPITAGNLPGSYIQDLNTLTAGEFNPQTLNSATPLHAQDTQPARIYSLAGDVVDGNAALQQPVTLVSDKPIQIQAGRDVVNLSLRGRNLYASDITLVAAGRDIYDAPLSAANPVPLIAVGGIGNLLVEAGRDVGPVASANEALGLGLLPAGSSAIYPGIDTVGNLYDPYLQRAGANITVLFGIGPGMNLSGYQSAGQTVTGFEQAYIDPANRGSGAGQIPVEGITRNADGSYSYVAASPVDSAGVPDYSYAFTAGGLAIVGQDAQGRPVTAPASSTGPQLVAFVEQYQADQLAQSGQGGTAPYLSPAAAWSVFQGLPAVQQQLFAGKVLLDVLNRTGLDFNNAALPYAGQYARGYTAINTLFPAALGYTANDLTGGSNGAKAPVATGYLDMRGSTIQTQQGGNIDILGPGGEVLVGSTAAPPQVAASVSTSGIGPNDQGILTLEQGSISIFADQSALLAQSRIFTEQGGDVLIWSSNGDINAGKGAKTNSEIPPPQYICDLDHYCVVDAKSQVSGAGIGVLQTKPGVASGNADLVAPRGTVDAGEAGIRVSGSLNVAAFRVANASNIQVQGKESGVPTGVVDTAALSVASAVSAAVEQTATQVAASQPPATAITTISVETVGFGQPTGEETDQIR
ncbi:MAG: filamentous hemagglutinin family protein [Nevskia sp.]|nr:filamentous hemagglutinin family protein [Nevskia sp.]